MSSSTRLSLAELCNQPFPSSSKSSSPSPMSSPDAVFAGIKRPLVVEDHDEDVRIAARALGDMRSRAVSHARAPSAEAFAVASQVHSRTSSASQSTPFLSPSTTPSSIANSSPVLQQEPLHQEHQEISQLSPASPSGSTPPPPKDFVSRMVHSPIVSSVLNAYEDSKKRSKVVQIGANLMESSVKTISRPVINRLPVNQFDEFACRQLDRICPARTTPSSPNAGSSKDNTALYSAYRDPPPLESGASSRAPSIAPDDYSVSNSPTLPPRGFPDDPEKSTKGSDRSSQHPSQHQQIAVKSKWQTMLSEAGGISAAVSQESMKRLQYCLQWLQYATNRIDAQIVILRTFIDSLTPQPPHQNDPHALVPLQVMRTLADVRRDLVKTVRDVVNVLSTYAGSALPEPARSTVRAFILRLPARWNNVAGGDASNPPSMPSSPPMQQQRLPSSENLAGLNNSLSQIQTQNGHPRPTAGRATHPTALAATQAAQRILTLATESLDMMRGVTNVFKDSLERADAWVERLRVVGINRHDGANNTHVPSSPGAGPSNSDISTPSLEGDTTPINEITLQKSYSSASSIHSATSLSLATQATSTSICTSPTRSINDEIVMVKRRKKMNGSTDTTDGSANENGHDRGDVQGEITRRQEEDETETEDAVSFKVRSAHKRSEEKTTNEETNTTTMNGSEGSTSDRSQANVNESVPRRRRNSAETDGSEGSFYSSVETQAKSMDIDP